MADRDPSLTQEYILLGLLRKQPDHGYALFERVQGTPELTLIWHVKRSKLYYLLDKLEGEGLLSPSVKVQEGIPDQKIYHLTESGERAFCSWLEEPVLASRYMRIAFLSKLYFGLQEGEAAAQKLIDRQLEVCREWLENLEGEAAQIDGEEFISRQVYQFRIGQITAIVEWLQHCRTQMSNSF